MKADRLLSLLQAAGLPAVNITIAAQQLNTAGTITWHKAGAMFVGVSWSAQPTAAQESQVDTVISSYADDPLDVQPSHIALAALLFRMSSKWAGATAAVQARVQAVIDAAAPAPSARG